MASVFRFKDYQSTVNNVFLMALPVLLWVNTAYSSDLISCVDKNVRATFFHGSYEYNENPDSMEQILLSQLQDPKAFRLIGKFTSTAPNRDFQSIGFATNLEIENAENAMIESLVKSGYRLVDNKEAKRTSKRQFGFRLPSSTRPERHAMCNANHDSVTVQARKVTAGVSVRVRFGGEMCYGRFLRDMTDGNLAPAFLPNLALPKGAVIRSSRGGGGGLTEASSNVSFETSLNIDEVHSDFQSQLSERGWTFDAQWGGDFIRGSAWSQVRKAGELKIIAVLQMRKSTDGFQAKVSVSLYD